MTVGPYYAQDSMYWKSGDNLLRDFEESRGAKLPTHKVVCPECNGTGTHVNRAIDGQGLSPDDPDLDDEFWDNYRGGMYDVRCEECNGNNVVDAIDEEACGSDPVKMALLREWNEYVQSNWESVQENLAELRMGA